MGRLGRTRSGLGPRLDPRPAPGSASSRRETGILHWTPNWAREWARWVRWPTRGSHTWVRGCGTSACQPLVPLNLLLGVVAGKVEYAMALDVVPGALPTVVARPPTPRVAPSYLTHVRPSFMTASPDMLARVHEQADLLFDAIDENGDGAISVHQSANRPIENEVARPSLVVMLRSSISMVNSTPG